MKTDTNQPDKLTVLDCCYCGGTGKVKKPVMLCSRCGHVFKTTEDYTRWYDSFGGSGCLCLKCSESIKP